jgi:predicted metal-binding membrane protein
LEIFTTLYSRLLCLCRTPFRVVIGVVEALKQSGAIAIGKQHGFFVRAFETASISR